MSQETEAHRLVACDEEALFGEIGRHLSPMGVQPPQRDRLAKLGREWFQANRGKLAQTLCRDDRLKSLAAPNLKTHEVVLAVAGVLDICSHLLGLIPAVTVAAVLVRLGLHSFCSDIWGVAGGEHPPR
jgi:hypothetical protein